VRILFWGTPAFAVPSLRALDDEGYDVVGVVTRPDRPAGRGRHLTASPVKEVALAQGFPVLTPEKPRGDEFMAQIRALYPDLSVVVAYGHILRLEVLDVPALASINVHASLLPALRGAAPINWAIARGHQETGITIMRMVQGMDAGPVIHTIREPILQEETASELTVRLSELGAEALVEALAMMAGGRAVELDQDHAAATFAPKVDRATARVDWARPAEELAWQVRGMDAVPGAWTELDGAGVKVFRPVAMDEAGGAEPGTVVAADDAQGLVVATGAGRLVLGEVQPPGRRRMVVQDWIHGRGIQAGQRFV
jgi:methionyl-tRNA formyltransferase